MLIIIIIIIKVNIPCTQQIKELFEMWVTEWKCLGVWRNPASCSNSAAYHVTSGKTLSIASLQFPCL